MQDPIQTPIGSAAFGMSSPADVQDLHKALSVDYQMPPKDGANALRAYSIDGTLRTVSYTQKHIKFWNRTPKLRAFSTVEEYVKLNNYGNQRTGAFVDAGALPPSQDSSYSRENKNVKYVGTTRAVQHQATVVETVVVDNLIAQEQINGTIYLLGVIERSFFDGDSSVISQEWDGIMTEIEKEYAASPESGIVIDLEGKDITKQDLTRGSNVILNNYGIPTLMYTDLDTMGRINELFYGNQFITNPDGAGVVGAVATDRFNYLPKQTFEYEPDVFLKPNIEPLIEASSENAPSAPTVQAATAQDAASKFKNAVNAKYIVAALNKYGESEGSTPVTASVQAGDKVTLTITRQGGRPIAGYAIYRADLATDTPKFIKRIPAQTTGNDTVFVDLNENIPGTGKAVLIFEDTTNWCFKQLIPFVKIPLAIVDASIRWMQLLYGVPILATPRKNVLFKNIKL